MNGLTQLAFVVLGLIAAGVAWWVLADVRKERRRARAETWAQEQVSPDADPSAGQREDDYPTVVLFPWQLEEPPELVRPYMRGRGKTDMVPSPHFQGNRTL
jgi:hypothetical protein